MKEQDYVIFLNKGSFCTRYDYITCMREVYVNPKIYIEKF